MIIFYFLRFETPPTWRARSPYLHPPGTRWPSYTPRHWVTFSSPPTTRRATVEVFDPAFTWVFSQSSVGMESSLCSLGADPTENTVSIVIVQQYFDCFLRIRCRKNVFAQPLSSNERLSIPPLHRNSCTRYNIIVMNFTIEGVKRVF
jgi:hypothetical protein